MLSWLSSRHQKHSSVERTVVDKVVVVVLSTTVLSIKGRYFFLIPRR